MSMHRKTITLTEQQAKERLATLRQALAEGESSGKPRPLEISAIKAAGRKRTDLFSASPLPHHNPHLPSHSLAGKVNSCLGC